MADADSNDPTPRSPPFDAAASSSSQAAVAGPAVAFDSHPSEVVLIQSYLRPWVVRGVRANAFVHVVDLYSAEPGDLTRQYPPAVSRGGERAWYFLSPLRTKSPRGIGRRKARTVADGTGCWHIEGKTKPVLDPLAGNRRVGYRQSLSFLKPGDGGGAPTVRNGWIMVELSLHDSGGGDRLDGLVLCKMYRSKRHPDSAAAALADDDGEGSCAVAVAAAPAAARHSDADDGDGSSESASDAPLAAAPGGERKADDEEAGSSAATPGRHSKNADDVETSGAAAAATPRRHSKNADDAETSGAAADDENGNSSGAAAPGLKEMAAGEDSSASSPARKRAKAADDEGPDAALARKNKQAGAPAAQLHCPECGFHLGALKLEAAVVTPAKSTSETETETETRQRSRAVERRVTFQ